MVGDPWSEAFLEGEIKGSEKTALEALAPDAAKGLKELSTEQRRQNLSSRYKKQGIDVDALDTESITPQDYSLKEISKTLIISVGTVKSRLFHAREKLKQILKQKYYENA